MEIEFDTNCNRSSFPWIYSKGSSIYHISPNVSSAILGAFKLFYLWSQSLLLQSKLVCLTASSLLGPDVHHRVRSLLRCDIFYSDRAFFIYWLTALALRHFLLKVLHWMVHFVLSLTLAFRQAQLAALTKWTVCLLCQSTSAYHRELAHGTRIIWPDDRVFEDARVTNSHRWLSKLLNSTKRTVSSAIVFAWCWECLTSSAGQEVKESEGNYFQTNDVTH